MSIVDQLYDYQREPVEFACSRPGAALFLEQGTGKTYIAAAIVERTAKRYPQGFSALLVVKLANIETTWVRTLEQIAGLVVCRTWQKYQQARQTAKIRVLLLHYEAVRGKLVRKLAKAHWQVVIYDESQHLKARGSKQSRAAARLRSVDHRVILSGTPIEQCPQDLWAQFRFALPDVFGRRWEPFAEQWFRKTGYMGYKLKFREQLMPKFLKLIEPHIWRVTKREVLDLPPLTYKRATVEMLGEQARVYREITEHMVCDVGGGTVTCDMAITQLIRQQQVCGGFVRLDPTEEERETARRLKKKKVKGRLVYLGSAKARRLKSILLAGDQTPVVVFCKYREELATIVKVCMDLGLAFGIVSGKTRKTRTWTIDSFQAGELDVLVCQIRAGGVGIDLFAANVAIFYSCTFSSIDFEQAVCRLHRNGQLRAVTVWLIQAANAVDEEIWSALLLKRSVTRLILDRRRRTRTMAKTEAAKPTTTDAKPTEKKKPTPPPQPPKPKYGVPELAAALGVKASSIRVRLRNAKIEKNGKLYGWDSKAEMQEVINKLKATKDKSKKAEEAEGDDEEADED